MRERKHEYIPGDYLMLCDSCGFVYRRSEMRKRWDNLWVCDSDWEPQHPQEFVRIRPERTNVPVARPDSSTSFGDDLLDGAVADPEWT